MENKILRNSTFKSELIKNARCVGKYDFPMLKKSTNVATKAIPFDKANNASDKNQWVHFYIDDYRFERLWNRPNRYLNMLKSFNGVIGTDFSVYTQMPLSMQIWNTYRNRILSFWMQNNGIDVIPNVVWGLENTYEFCFDGIPKGSTVAISKNGCIQDKTDRYYFKKGLIKMLEIINPNIVMVYSNMPNDIFETHTHQGVHFVNIPNYHVTLRKRGGI